MTIAWHKSWTWVYIIPLLCTGERPEPEGMWMQVSLPLWKHLAALGIYKVFCKGKIGKQCIVTCSFSPCSAHSIQGMSTV